MAKLGVDKSRFGWASIQLDGGIEKVSNKVEEYFTNLLSKEPVPTRSSVSVTNLRIGLLAPYSIPEKVAQLFAAITTNIVTVGGTVVIPKNQKILTSATYMKTVLSDQLVEPSLSYSQFVTASKGLHIMHTPSNHWVEILTGLGATGVEILVVFIDGPPLQTHPLIPIIQITQSGNKAPHTDFDFVIDDNTTPEQLFDLVIAVASRVKVPKLFGRNEDFQIARGNAIST